MYHIKDSTKLCEFTIKEETYRKHRQNDEQQRFEAKHRGNVKLNVSSRNLSKHRNNPPRNDKDHRNT